MNTMCRSNSNSYAPRSKELVMIGTSSFAVLTISSFVVLTLISPSAHAQTNGDPVPQVRMKWQDFVSGPDGTKRLASLQKAVAKMKSLDNAPPTSADFRRSWTYWAKHPRIPRAAKQISDAGLSKG